VAIFIVSESRENQVGGTPCGELFELVPYYFRCKLAIRTVERRAFGYRTPARLWRMCW
jgi:hypothetical protein